MDDPQWEDLKTVLAMVRTGTLAAAGVSLGVNYTTVARRITRIEADLGEPLFDRFPEGYRANAAARRIAEHAAQMEIQVDSMLRQMSGQDQSLTGQLVVTAPQLVIAHVLAPVLHQFAQRFPEIDLRLRASNDLLDLDRREADVAIRISRDPGDNLVGRKLTGQVAASFANTDWAARLSRDPDMPVDWLVYEGYGALPYGVARAGQSSRILMQFDDMVAMTGAAQAGLGVVRMPMFLGRKLGLVQVDLLRPQPYPDIWLLSHSDVWPSAKVQAFRDLIVPFFKAEKALFLA